MKLDDEVVLMVLTLLRHMQQQVAIWAVNSIVLPILLLILALLLPAVTLLHGGTWCYMCDIAIRPYLLLLHVHDVLHDVG